MNRFLAAIVGAVLVLAGAQSGTARADIFRWTGASSPGTFSNPFNWNPTTIPGALDHVIYDINGSALFSSSPTNHEVVVSGASFANGIAFNFNQAGNQTYSMTFLRTEDKGHAVLNGLDVAVTGAITLSRGGTITVNSGSRLSASGLTTAPIAPNTFGVTGHINVNAGGTLELGQLQLGAGNPVKSSNGTMDMNGGAALLSGGVFLSESGSAGIHSRITMTNGAVFTQTGGTLSIATHDGINDSHGTLSISGIGTGYRQVSGQTQIGSTLQGRGTLSITNGGTFEAFGNFNVNRRGTVIVNGGTFVGTMAIPGGNLTYGAGGGGIHGNIALTNAGSITASAPFTVSPGRRLSATSGTANFNNGLNLAINSAGTVEVGSSGTLNAAGTSTWGSGSTSTAVGSFMGNSTVGNLLIGANGAGATITIGNGGTVTVQGAGGLVIGDAVGTAPARMIVKGPVGAIKFDQFIPTFINRRGSIELIDGGIYRGERMVIDGGTFDGTAGVYTFSAINPFAANVTVTNAGVFKGNSLLLSPGFLTVSNGGSASLTGTLSINTGAATFTGASSRVQAAGAVLSRGTITIAAGANASFDHLSAPFNPFGGATLNVMAGGALETNSLLDIGSNARLLVHGDVTVAGALINAGTIAMTGGTLKVTGVTTNTGTLHIDAPAGTSVNLGNVSGTGRLTSAGQSVVTFNHLRQGIVGIDGATSLVTRPNGGNTGVSRVNILVMGNLNPATKWNLNDNDLIVDYPVAGPSSASLIRGYIKSGRNGGSWDGPGLSSASAAVEPRRALGYADNALLHYTSFGGQQVDDSTVLVKYTSYGDTDLNGVINFDDYGRTDSGFLTGGSTWMTGDFNYDDVVNFDDYALIDAAFLNQRPGAIELALRWLGAGGGGDVPTGIEVVGRHYQQFGEPYAASFTAAIPEPAGAATTLTIALLLGSRQRQRT